MSHFPDINDDGIPDIFGFGQHQLSAGDGTFDDPAESIELDINRHGAVDSVEAIVLFNLFLSNIEAIPSP